MKAQRSPYSTYSTIYGKTIDTNGNNNLTSGIVVAGKDLINKTLQQQQQQQQQQTNIDLYGSHYSNNQPSSTSQLVDYSVVSAQSQDKNLLRHYYEMRQQQQHHNNQTITPTTNPIRSHSLVNTGYPLNNDHNHHHHHRINTNPGLYEIYGQIVCHPTTATTTTATPAKLTAEDIYATVLRNVNNIDNNNSTIRNSIP
ncbi:hypothetical protein BLA29_005772, partial [Euroglyphus maynei]